MVFSQGSQWGKKPCIIIRRPKLGRTDLCTHILILSAGERGVQ